MTLMKLIYRFNTTFVMLILMEIYSVTESGAEMKLKYKQISKIAHLPYLSTLLREILLSHLLRLFEFLPSLQGPLLQNSLLKHL